MNSPAALGPVHEIVMEDGAARFRRRVVVPDSWRFDLSLFAVPASPWAMGSGGLAGGSLLLSHPESGALFTEYSVGGYAWRSIGSLRSTSFESDRALHIAMNAGLPLVDPTGGFYYVFITGTPMFRKYDNKGELLFERVIQGRDIDLMDIHRQFFEKYMEKVRQAQVRPILP